MKSALLLSSHFHNGLSFDYKPRLPKNLYMRPDSWSIEPHYSALSNAEFHRTEGLIPKDVFKTLSTL